jgi:hypothetical protein
MQPNGKLGGAGNGLAQLQIHYITLGWELSTGSFELETQFYAIGNRKVLFDIKYPLHIKVLFQLPTTLLK